MFVTILRREIQGHLLSRRFYICLVTATILIVMSAALLGQRQKQNWSEYREAISAQEHLLHNYAHSNRINPMMKALMPPAPMGALFACIGGSDDISTIYNDPLRGLFAPVDLIFIIAILMSLFAIILSYDAVCGEREDGTLRLVLTYPLGRARLLLAKLTAGFIVLTLSLLVSFCLGILMALLSGSLAWRPSDWGGLIMVLLATLLYVQVFFTLGVLISTSTKESGNAVFAGLLAWGFLVLLVPSISPSIAEWICPIPSPNVVEAKARQLDQQREVDLKAMWRRLDAEGLPDSEVARRGATEVSRINKSHREAVAMVREPFEAKLVLQTGIGWLLASVSPYTNYVSFASSASGIGIQRQASFRKQSEQFGRAFHEFLTPQIERLKETFPLDYHDRRLDLAGRPVFTFEEPSFRERLVPFGIVHFTLLVFFSFLFFISAFVRFLRYDPR